MGQYKIKIQWSGYSRGTSEYIVDAENEEEAKETYWEYEPTRRDIVRDDTEQEFISIEKIKGGLT